jgi:hypothetical protein
MPPTCKDGTQNKRTEKPPYFPKIRGHKFPLYRAEAAAAEANGAFTARSSGAMFGKGAISGFHLTPNLSSNARSAYSFRRCSYSCISVSPTM